LYIEGFIIYTHYHLLLVWTNQGDELGRTFGRHGGNKKCIQNISLKIWKEETTWET